MAICGLHHEDSSDAASLLAMFALAIRLRLQQLNESFKFEFRLRIGLNVGPCVAGVVGRRRLYFDVWGDSVNTASRMVSCLHYTVRYVP